MNKLNIIILAVTFLLCIICISCNNNAQIANPIIDSSYEELNANGFVIEIPNESTEIHYSLIADKIGQVNFTYNDNVYTLRSSITESNISGIYVDYPKTETVSSTQINSTLNHKLIEQITISIKYGTTDYGMLAEWSYNNVNYSLYGDSNNQNLTDFRKTAKQIVYLIQKNYIPF